MMSLRAGSFLIAFGLAFCGSLQPIFAENSDCKPLLKTVAATRLDEAKSRYQSAETIAKIYAAANAQGLSPFNLEGASCEGASYALRRLVFPGDDLAEVKTYGPLDGGRDHVYLVKLGFFEDGSPLIVDPTIRQFFASRYYSQIPTIFVGSPEELLQLMKDAGRSDLAERYFAVIRR